MRTSFVVHGVRWSGAVGGHDLATLTPLRDTPVGIAESSVSRHLDAARGREALLAQLCYLADLQRWQLADNM
jgi:hypothetical protein